MKRGICLLLAIALVGWWCGKKTLRAAGYAKICFEAEDSKNVEPPMKIVRPTPRKAQSPVMELWSPPGYVDHPDAEKKNDDRGSALYTFEVTTTSHYYLWLRTWWMDGCGNSVAAQIDNYAPVTLGQDGTYEKWHWVQAKGAKFKLTAGKHTLKLLGREDGTKIDQIFLTDDSEYVPEGIRKPTQKAS